MSEEKAICKLCGHPMPKGEEMFHYHGYSGPCPEPPIKDQAHEVHRSSVTGQFVTEAEAEANPAETTTETVKTFSPYIKKLILLGDAYEKSGGAPDELGHLVTWAVNGMSAE